MNSNSGSSSSKLSIIGMITERREEEEEEEIAHMTSDNKLKQYEKEIDIAIMAHIDRMQ